MNAVYTNSDKAKTLKIYVIYKQHTLDELVRFLPQLSDLVPLTSGFYSFRAQADQHHPVDPRGVANLYP